MFALSLPGPHDMLELSWKSCRILCCRWRSFAPEPSVSTLWFSHFGLSRIPHDIFSHHWYLWFQKKKNYGLVWPKPEGFLHCILDLMPRPFFFWSFLRAVTFEWYSGEAAFPGVEYAAARIQMHSSGFAFFAFFGRGNMQKSVSYIGCDVPACPRPQHP